MDVGLARTFLAVVESGSFVEAADIVHVTQSTVSARIKSLEDQLGKQLFERNKSGAILTLSGQQFLKHAQAIIRVWEHARLEIALPDGYETALTVGGQYSLWPEFLIDWLANMRRNYKHIAVRAQLGFSDILMENLINGTLDFGIMYTPQARVGFEVEPLFVDELVLATSCLSAVSDPMHNYVMIDWGPEFRSDHALNFPDISIPGTYLELGALSVDYLLKIEGSGYVPKRLLKNHLENEQLFVSKLAPRFSYPAYFVYPSDMDLELVEPLKKQLKATVLEKDL